MLGWALACAALGCFATEHRDRTPLYAIASGLSATRKLANQRRPGIAPTLAARPQEDSRFADHQALASRFHCRPRHFSKRVDFENPLDRV